MSTIIIRPTLTSIASTQEFKNILAENPGTIIIKFGAEWCGPCKRIDPQVHQWFDHLSKTKQNIQTYLIDVDNNMDLYGFLKTKKMVNGIPAILAYKSGNMHYIPNDSVLGANPPEIDAFFHRCMV